MATIMTKRGQLDNVITYEHICDTVADMTNINPSYVTLGSVCIVIKGENDDLEVYMADSKKEWKIVSFGAGESSGEVDGAAIHICAQDEYDSVTGMPTIQAPLSNTFYLTPGGSETNDLYNEWIWLEEEEEWEKFGSAVAGGVSDVQVNGVSVVTDGVANVPMANMTTVGAFKTGNYKGLVYDINTGFGIDASLTALDIKAANRTYRFAPIAVQHISTFYGLAKAAGDTTQSASANNVGDYTESAKSAISEMLGGSVAVTGTTPSITALPGVRYVCGEVMTIDITIPATGIVDVVFTSGSTPAVLTVTPPNGVTMKWANDFDPTTLDANTVYEINVMDGKYGVVGSWT